MIYFTSFIYGIVAFHAYKFFPTSTIVISLTLAAIFAKKKFLSGLLIVIVALSGFFYSYIRYEPQTPFEEVSNKTLLVKGVPVSDAVSRSGSDEFSQVIEIKEAFYEDHNPLNISQINLISNKMLYPERLYFLKVRMYPYYLNPGSFKNMASGYAIEIKEIGNADVSSFQRIRQKARSRIKEYIKNNFSEESAPFIMAIVTGERRFFTKETRDAFNSTGLAHILSISGSHFGLLFIILFTLFRFIIKNLPQSILSVLTLYLTPSQIAAILSIPFMIGYLALSAMNVPPVRAFIMISLFLVGILISRKGFWLNTLLFAAFVIALIHPHDILELSFQLSFMAVLCIGIVAEYMRNQNRPYPDSYARRYILFPALISFSASIGTAPLVAYYFHYLSIVSAATNVIITPIIGFIILPISLMSSFIYLFFGIFPLHFLVDTLTAFLINVIKHIAELEFSSVNIPAYPPVLLISFTIGVLIYIFLEADRQQSGNRKLFLANYPFAIFVALSIMPFIVYIGIKFFEYKGISVTYLDVGQGDSAVVELPDRRTIVVDAGEKGFQVRDFLRYRGIKKIDAVILSHGDYDHAGGIRNIIEDFDVVEIWDNGRLVYPEGFLKGIKLRSFNRGDVVKGNGYTIFFLHPYKGFYTMNPKESDENNDSLVLRIQTDKNSFLFTGDIESEAAEDISYLKPHLKSSVLKVPHHGSRSSASETFMDAVSPEIAVISVGRGNIHRNPHKEILQLLSDTVVLRTDTDGAIGISETKDGGLRVNTWNEFRIKEAKSLQDELMNLKKLFFVW